MSYSTYLQNNTRNGFCPFCEEQSSAIDENETAFVLPARAPYIQDHLLICTKTHKQYLSDLTAQELQDIQELMLKWSEIIKKKHGEFVVFLRQGTPF
jgi:diadenosine tetraphosphate (Ap4A) HIT family hydrolase